MVSVTRKDVCVLIDNLNERYHFDDTTKLKFDLICAYGGCQIVLRIKNRGAKDITTGFLSSRECINNFYDKLDRYGWESLDSLVISYLSW